MCRGEASDNLRHIYSKEKLFGMMKLALSKEIGRQEVRLLVSMYISRYHKTLVVVSCA